MTNFTNAPTLQFSNGFAVTQPGGAGTKVTVDGSGFLHTTGNETASGNKTLTGATTLAGTTISSGQTFTAGAGTTVGTGVNISTGNGLAGGTALNVDTGTSTFSGNAVNITSGGVFTGTLVNLAANSTTAGTILGITGNALITGAAINANVGSAYTGAGIIRLTANAASTGTLLAVSGTTLGLNGGNAAQFTLGTPGGAEPAEGKAIRVALGTVGDAYYANAATGYTDSFARFQVAGVDVFKVTGTTITTTDSFSQTGAATFSTGTGAISLNGDTTIAAGKNLTAASGSGKLDFSAGSGTFDTSTGAVTLRGNTATASGVTLTAGSGIINAVNAVTVTTGALTTGSAIKVDVGTTAPGGAVNSTQGLALDISGTGAFAGLGNTASLAKITSTGAFSGTLAMLSAANTLSGTVLGISATSLSTGKAIDVQLGGSYVGGGANQGAVNVRSGAFSGNLLSVSASSDAQTVTTSLANFAAPLTQGHLVNLTVNGAYTGTGALYVDLTAATGTVTGTSIAVNAVTGYTGRFIDLQIAGSPKFAVDPTNGTTTSLNFAQSSTTTFSTGTGNISLNGAVTLASAKGITSAGGAANFDFSASTGTFQTGSGNISLNGNIITNINQTGTTTFTTGSGAVTLSGPTTVSGTNAFTSGSGAVTLNGSTSIVSGKTLSVGGGSAIKVIELGTCTNANNAQTTCSTANANTSLITLANLVATDSITISGQTAATAGRPCVVDSITAGTSFRINCTANPGTLVWNVLVVRR